MAADRDRLIEKHLKLVHAIAAKLRRSLGRSIEYQDLVAYGSKGLVEAAARFDPQQGVTFTTYAYYRVRGAMLDGLRTMGWYSRADYARYRAEERANEFLQNLSDRAGAAHAAAGASATGSAGAGAGAGGSGKLADASGGAEARAQALGGIADILGGIATVHITSIDAASAVMDDRLPAPDAGVERAEVNARVRAAVAKLPEKERRLMELYYFGDHNLEEAGAELGLSKSWACRLHARAVTLLRSLLAEE